MDVRFYCEPLFCLSLTGTKAPILLSPRDRATERRVALMGILEEKRRISLLRARRRMVASPNLVEQRPVDSTGMVAMKRQCTSDVDIFSQKEDRRPHAVRSLTDISRLAIQERNSEEEESPSIRSLGIMNDSCLVSSKFSSSPTRKKRKKSHLKSRRKELDTSLVLSAGKQMKTCSNSVTLRECAIAGNNIVSPSKDNSVTRHHPQEPLPPISFQELIVQSVIPLRCVKEETSPELDCKPRAKVTVFRSDRHSQMLKEQGIPAAPPCTPTEGILSPTLYGQDSLTSLLLIEFSLSLSEHLERHVYVASLSDIRSQRLVKARLYALEEKAEQKKTKADEEARALAKKYHLQSIAALKSQQRAEIYALNRLMTELEHENFLLFCKTKVA